MIVRDRFRFGLSPGTGKSGKGASDSRHTQDANLSEAHEHGGSRNSVGQLESEDLVIGKPVTVFAGFLDQVLARNQESAREPVHGRFESDCRVPGRPDVPAMRYRHRAERHGALCAARCRAYPPTSRSSPFESGFIGRFFVVAHLASPAGAGRAHRGPNRNARHSVPDRGLRPDAARGPARSRREDRPARPGGPLVGLLSCAIARSRVVLVP